MNTRRGTQTQGYILVYNAVRNSAQIWQCESTFEGSMGRGTVVPPVIRDLMPQYRKSDMSGNVSERDFRMPVEW